MSKFYNPKRIRNIFDPDSPKPFKLSRSKIDLFLECPRCFYFDRRVGTSRPPGYPFNLNSAVDTLLKQEFDIHRAKGTQHPLLEKYGLNARPAAHESLNVWRENFKGLAHHHLSTNFIVTGAIDDLWENEAGEYIVVDYKATAKAGVITELNNTWHKGYKRQMEIYQWLLRQMGHKVSSTGYFVYCNGQTDKAAFDAKLEFEVTLIPYTGQTDWIEPALEAAKNCLTESIPPEPGAECDYCAYRRALKDCDIIVS